VTQGAAAVATAAALGVLVGGIVSGLISWQQLRHEIEERRREREREQLAVAARLVRQSAVAASALAYRRSRPRSRGPAASIPEWEAFLYTVTDATSAVAIVPTRLPDGHRERYVRAADAVLRALSISDLLLNDYYESVAELATDLEDRLKDLAGIRPAPRPKNGLFPH
jgi:hypothetical protein